MTLPLSDLKKLPQHDIVTSTMWTKRSTFHGPLVRDLLRLAGAKGTVVRISALNEYSIRIPIDDFNRYDVVLAHQLNGRSMPIREKGPFWVMYPVDALSEQERFDTIKKLIWQVSQITVE